MSHRHPLDWFFLLRPTLLFPVCTVFLAGYRLGTSPLLFWEWAVFSLSAIAMGGAVYVLNEVSDIESDSANNKLHYLPRGIFSVTTARNYGIVLGVLGIAGLTLIAKLNTIWIALGFIITGVLYNVRPFRWKDRPTAGILVAVAGGGLTFWAGMLLGKAPMHHIPEMIPYLFAFGGVSVFTQLLDTDGDRKSGKITLAVRYGIPIAIKIGWSGIALALVLAIAINDLAMILSAGIPLLFGLLKYRNYNIESCGLIARFAILLLSLTIGSQYPVYLLTIFVYYFIARWYYRLRFDLQYPSLTGNSW